MPRAVTIYNGDSDEIGTSSVVGDKIEGQTDSRDSRSPLHKGSEDSMPERDEENRLAMAVEFDHMYIGCSESKASIGKDIEVQHLKDLLLLHLDLIQQQAEQLVAKDKVIKRLRDENENLKAKLDRIDRRVSLSLGKKASESTSTSIEPKIEPDSEEVALDTETTKRFGSPTGKTDSQATKTQSSSNKNASCGKSPSSKPLSPASKPGSPASKPGSPASKPGSPSSKPSSPASKPGSPVGKPGSPASKARSPPSKPGSSSSKTGSPASKPVSPASKPVSPASKPVSPASKPLSPASKPLSPASKPLTPASKPLSPASKPGSPVNRTPSSAVKVISPTIKVSPPSKLGSPSTKSASSNNTASPRRKSLSPEPKVSSPPSKAPSPSSKNGILNSKPSSPPCMKPSSPPCVKPSSPPCVKPSSPPCVKPSSPPCVKPSSPPCVKPSSPPCVKPSSPPCVKPSSPPPKIASVLNNEELQIDKVVETSSVESTSNKTASINKAVKRPAPKSAALKAPAREKRQRSTSQSQISETESETASTKDLLKSNLIEKERSRVKRKSESESDTSPPKRIRSERDSRSSHTKDDGLTDHNLRSRDKSKDRVKTKAKPQDELPASPVEIAATPSPRAAALEAKKLRQKLQLKGKTPIGSSVRAEGILNTTVSYYLPYGALVHDPNPEEECLQAQVEIPRWGTRVLTSLYVMEGTENLEDEIFVKRHAKPEQDEKRRKRWDLQRMREQRHYERLRERYESRQSSSEPTVSGHGSLWPHPEQAMYLHVEDTLPVCAFGQPLARIPPQEFAIPWLTGHSSEGVSTRRRKR